MKYLSVRFGARRRKRVMVNEPLEQRKEQEEAQREYERQAELRTDICPVVTFQDIRWLKEIGIEW